MSKFTVESLRKSGYQVRVTHVRSLNDVILTEDGVYDNLASRFEYENASVVNGAESFLTCEVKTAEDIPFSSAVLPCGGFTKVEVTTPEGVTVTGKFNFNHRRFKRKIGVAAALGRAMKGLN